MSDYPEPPLADLKRFNPAFVYLAQPLYELVNKVPRREYFPTALTVVEAEDYRSLLQRALRRVVDSIEPVSCSRVPGLIGRREIWFEYRAKVDAEQEIDGDINELIQELNDRTEDRTQDTEYELIPTDLLERATWFYRELTKRDPSILPFDPAYGQIMCRVLAMGVTQPHPITDKIFPFLVGNPPLGFVTNDKPDAYSVLVA